MLLPYCFNTFGKPTRVRCKQGVAMLFIVISTAFLAHAQQTHFKAKPKAHETNFAYQWKHENQQYSLDFTISNLSLLAMPDSPANYSDRVFQEAVYRDVMLKAKGIDPKLARINIKKQNGGLSFNVQSSNADQAQLILDQLSEAYSKAQYDYWAENYFVEYQSPTGQNGIRHDHAKYSEMSSEALMPIVEAIKNIQQNKRNPREFVQIALSWIQSIPYDKLENRISSNGAGFVSPRDLILQNKGDCDSKSTLMAALLKAYNPRISLEMVFLRNHALLAIAMRPLPDDRFINKKGVKFVLLEPTGPALLPIGEVGDDTKMALRNRQFDTSPL